jgi:hypothetical protein
MATTVTSSGLGKINWRDIIEGLKVAVGLPVLTIIYTSIQAGNFTFDWKLIGLTATGGFISYIIKKLTTAPQIIIKDVSKEDIASVKSGEANVQVVTK